MEVELEELTLQGVDDRILEVGPGPAPMHDHNKAGEKEGGDMDRGDPDRDMGDPLETGLGVELPGGTTSDTSEPNSKLDLAKPNGLEKMKILSIQYVPYEAYRFFL